MNEQLTTSERLRQVIEEKHITYAELERLSGVPKSAIQRYASGNTKKIPLDRIFRIADALGVAPFEIVGMDHPWESEKFLAPEWSRWKLSTDGQDPVQQALEDQSLPSNVRPISELHRQSVPLIGKVAAGQPIMAETDYETFVTSPVECDAALEVEGESMVPTYLPGDIVYIKHQPTVRDGQVAVVLLDDSATLKRVYREKDGLMLVSDNQDYSPIHVTDAEYDYVAIYGVPVGYTRIYKPSIEGKIKKEL